MGALLAPGKRTVTAALRITGREAASNFTRYHQVLNRARRSSRAVAGRLLTLIVAHLVMDGPVVIGIDDTSGAGLRYRPGSKIVPLRWVLIRDPSGARTTPAFFSTDPELAAEDILALNVRRRHVGVTFAEVRAHLGVETQRQWSDLVVMRTTPALLGLYSLVMLWEAELFAKGATPQAAAWRTKTRLTFSDALAAVRLRLGIGNVFLMSPGAPDRKKIPPEGLIRMAQALCHAA